VRVILEGGNRPERQMALDEAMLILISKDLIPQTLRLWTFSPTTLSIGRFLAVQDWVDMAEITRAGIRLVRRFTGGGPALHDENGEITWTVVMKGDDMMSAYRAIGRALVKALEELGLKGEFIPINDVVVGGKKIVGMAGARRRNGILVHGTFMYSTDLSLLRCIKVPKEKEVVRGKPETRVTTVSLSLGREVKKEEAMMALLKGFEALGELKVDQLTELEEDLAEQLKYKYSNDAWTFQA
jgi:lipoate-protein ligase A